MFRSGEISGITPTGDAPLKELRNVIFPWWRDHMHDIWQISVMQESNFDLRSDIETVKFGRTLPALGSQVEMKCIPMFTTVPRCYPL